MGRVMKEPTGVEQFFGDDELIVSKTDAQGRITYANRVFRRISGFGEDELVGQPHSMIRHPDMPRAVFRLLWERLESGREIFAYVVNLTKTGDHYWVFAHVTPTLDGNGRTIGHHSNRRRPDRAAVATVQDLYGRIRDVEVRHDDRARAAAAGLEALNAILAERGASYDEWIFSTIG